MELDTEKLKFLPWLRYEGIPFFFWVVLGIVTISLVAGYLLAAFRHGPVPAFWVTGKVLLAAILDTVGMSPRRIFALGWLAVRESLGKRVLIVVLVMFVMILMYAAWFLDPDSKEPGRLYLNFVLSWTSFFVLIPVLLLSSFSLPADIKTRTLHTVVTKPVRAGEIVLGRIVGFAAIGTVLLVVMGTMSYVFVIRSLSHTHTISTDELVEVKDAQGNVTGWKGQTTLDQRHRHEVNLHANGTGQVEPNQSHWHEVTRDGSDWVVGPPRGMLTARVPLYGELSFTDRRGEPANKGISVGKEHGYKSYIQGASLASATWTFEDVRPEKFADADGNADHLPVAMTLGVFRTYKGTITQGILGSITLRNPQTGLTSRMKTFHALEYYIQEVDLPRAQLARELGPDGKPVPVDLFEDLVSEDGRLEVQIRCEERMQYFGMGKGDLYLRGSDALFRNNFIKGHVGIWLQMIVVAALGVMFSTFLSSAVTMLATTTSILMGSFTEGVLELSRGQLYGGGPIYGGGPLESLVRLVKQQNLTSPMEPGWDTTIMKMIDQVLLFFLWVAVNLLPDFSSYSDADFVSHGFNIPAAVTFQHMVSALAYLSVVFVAGYFFLKTREVAR